MQLLLVLGQLPDALKGGVLGAVRVKTSALSLGDASDEFWLGPDGFPCWNLVGGDDLSVILDHVRPRTPLGKALLQIGLILHPAGSPKSKCAADAEHFCCVRLSAPNGFRWGRAYHYNFATVAAILSRDSMVTRLYLKI